MDIQRVHEYIWDQVIEDLSAGRHRYDINGSKRNAIMNLMSSGDITKQEENALHRYAECALCYEHPNCVGCPLYQLEDKKCTEEGSLWDCVNDAELSLQKRIEVARMIRDIFHQEVDE